MLSTVNVLDDQVNVSTNTKIERQDNNSVAAAVQYSQKSVSCCTHRRCNSCLRVCFTSSLPTARSISHRKSRRLSSCRPAGCLHVWTSSVELDQPLFQEWPTPSKVWHSFIRKEVCLPCVTRVRQHPPHSKSRFGVQSDRTHSLTGGNADDRANITKIKSLHVNAKLPAHDTMHTAHACMRSDMQHT